MRVVVTGGAGFIGSHVVDRFRSAGHEVVVVDDLSRGRRENVADGVPIESIDVAERSSQSAIAALGPEVICHLAAQIDVRVSVTDPLEDARQNVLGTINVLEAARSSGTRKVVFASSGGSIYGTPTRRPVDESVPTAPESPYAAAKVAGELYLHAFAAMYDVQTTSLALGNVYGPRQDPHGEAGVVAIFASALLEGRPTRIFGDGTSTRDYVYVGDVAEAFFAAAGDVGNGRRFNIGTGLETSVRELHGLVAAAVGAPDEPEFAAPRLGELQAISLDWHAARDALGWEPRVAMKEGIEATVAWIRSSLSP